MISSLFRIQKVKSLQKRKKTVDCQCAFAPWNYSKKRIWSSSGRPRRKWVFNWWWERKSRCLFKNNQKKRSGTNSLWYPMKNFRLGPARHSLRHQRGKSIKMQTARQQTDDYICPVVGVCCASCVLREGNRDKKRRIVVYLSSRKSWRLGDNNLPRLDRPRWKKKMP